MELLFVSILFVSSFSSLTSHPKNSEILPKDYYKRQVLQPIPGYIPVYIKADVEPQVRLEKISEESNEHSNKAVQLEETNQFRKHDTEILTKEDDKKFEKLKSEGTTKDASNKFENRGKAEGIKSKEKFEKGKNYQFQISNQKRHA